MRHGGVFHAPLEGVAQERVEGVFDGDVGRRTASEHMAKSLEQEGETTSVHADVRKIDRNGCSVFEQGALHRQARFSGRRVIVEGHFRALVVKKRTPHLGRDSVCPPQRGFKSPSIRFGIMNTHLHGGILCVRQHKIVTKALIEKASTKCVA